MYLLLSRIPNGLDPLRDRFEAHVKKAGLESVEKSAGVAADNIVCLLLLFYFHRSLSPFPLITTPPS